MGYDLIVDGLQTKVTLHEDKLMFESSGKTETSYQLNDVIGCDEAVKGWFNKTEFTRLWLIENGASNMLMKECKIISGDQRKDFQQDLTKRISNGTKRPKRVLIMINPIGGNGTAIKDFRNIVEPVFKLAGISMDIIFSERAGHMIDVAKTYDISKIDGIVLLGGDGSYHEVINVLMRRRQEEQGVDINDQNATLSPLNIPIAMIPTGTGCVVTEKYTGCKDVLTVALHVVKGRTVSSHLLALYNNGKLLGFGGTSCTYGILTDLFYYSDRKFRWLGRSRYFIVPMWMFLFKSQTNRAFTAKVTYFTSVTERRNSEINETEIFVEDKKLSGYSSYTSDTVIFDRKLWNMMTLNGNVIFDGQVVFDVPKMFVPKHTTFSTFHFYGGFSAGVMFRFLKHVARRTPMENVVQMYPRSIHIRKKRCFLPPFFIIKEKAVRWSEQIPEVSNNDLEALNVRGFTVEMKDSFENEDPELTLLRRLIQLDGEMYELESPSFQLWYKLDVVQIFSSYL